jgi:hypothetical protein
MIEHDDVLNMFRVDFIQGRLFWAKAPRPHPRLLGEEAGSPRLSTNKKKTYWYVKINGVAHKRGHLIFFAATGLWPAPCLDHIDGNSLNNTPSNLQYLSFNDNISKFQSTGK